MNIRKKIVPVLALALTAAAGAARAGSIADLGLSLEQIRALNAQMTAPIVAPGIAFGSPTAYGAGWGQAFGGIGGQTIPPGAEESVDGSALVGVGFGDPRRVAGFEMSMNIISLQDGFGDDGNWNYKLHRALPWRSAIAIGVEDTGAWGAATDRGSSSYIAFSQAVDLTPDVPKRPLTLTYNVGGGNHRFADPVDRGAAAFGSVSLAWHRQASVIADWNGRDLGAAASFVPFYRMPVVVTVGFINLTERYSDREFAGGIGYLYQF